MPGLVDDPDPDFPRTITGAITGPDTSAGPPGRGVPPRRRLTTPSAVMLGAVAALVVAVLLVGRNSAEVPERAQVSDPTPTAERSEPVEPVPVTGSPRFASAADVPVTVVLPPGWDVEDVFVSKDWPDGYGLAFYEATNIYADPCRWELLDPPVGPTVEDLTRALAESPAWQAGVPSDVVVDGYAGKHLTFTLPAYDPEDCQFDPFWAEGLFGLFKDKDPQNPPEHDGGTHPNLWALGPLQRNEVWILDVDGTRLVILLATMPDTPPEDVADLWEMMASIRIGPPRTAGEALETTSPTGRA